MEIHLGYELRFEVPRPTPMQLMLYVHPEQASRLRQPERIEIEPATAVEDFVDAFGNRAARILAPAGTVRVRYDNVIGDSGRAETPITGARPSPAARAFSAGSEVYLDGAWHPIAARHNRPRIGRVLMARGRDAVDVALTTSFGAANLTQFIVWTDEIPAAAA